MSENNTNPGSQPDWDQQEEKVRDKRVILLAGVAAAAVLGGGAYFLLGSGGSDDTNASSVPVAAAPRASATASAAPLPAPGTVLPAPATATGGRNPFKPLYVAPVANSGPTSGGTATSTTTTGTAGSPVVTAGPTTAGSTAEYPLVLNTVGTPDVDLRTASFTVDGTKTDVVRGQRFGKFKELVVLGFSGNDVVVQVGDASPLTIKVGQTVQVL
jgi:hypothetical protein